MSAEAQSAFACNGLEGATTPVVEGADGMFFRIDTDLLSDTRIAWPIVDEIAHLARAFEERGSQLVVVPLPTKGLVHADRLVGHAEIYGFEPDLAEWLYRETLARMTSQGITTIDALSALRSTQGDEVFFATDPRLTNAGIAKLAEAVSQELERQPNGYAIKPPGTSEFSSILHQQIQSRCNLSLPAPTTPTYDTISLTSAAPSERVVVVSSGEITGPGLIAESLFELSLGSDVEQNVIEGAPLETLTSVLAGDTFQTRLPEAVVWIVPVSVDLGARGLEPFREMTGLARRSCRSLPDSAWTSDEGHVAVELSQTPVTQASGIMVTLADKGAQRVVFHIENTSGQKFRRSITRREVTTPRFLLSFASFSAGDIEGVTVDLAGGEPNSVQDIAICGI